VIFEEGSALDVSRDIWQFVCDDETGEWTWKRLSPTGEELAASAYAFASLRVCIADAERAGFHPTTTVVRRLRASDLGATGHPRGERRRRPRDSSRPWLRLSKH
jgi:hypothetical protein